MDLFSTCMAIVAATEGGLSLDAGDPGNWTGGAIGGGTLEGTNFGIAAADYESFLEALPPADAAGMPASVADLTLAQAETIYQLLVWQPIQGDALPPRLALIMFDAAVNCGVSQSAQWLQGVVGVAQDGVIGPETLAAVTAWKPQAGDALGAADTVAALCAEVLAERLYANGGDADFSTMGLGWSRRCARLAFQAEILVGSEA